MSFYSYTVEDDREFFSRRELVTSLFQEVEAVCFRDTREPEILQGEASKLWAPMRTHLEEIPLGGLCYFEKVQEVQQTLLFAATYAQAISALNSVHVEHIPSYFDKNLAPGWQKRFANVELSARCTSETHLLFRKAMQLGWITASQDARLPLSSSQYENAAELPSTLQLPKTDKEFQEIGMEASVFADEIISEAYLPLDMKFCQCAGPLYQLTCKFARVFRLL